MRLILVRHGETEWNKEQILQGNTAGIRLNTEGRKQAERIAGHLKKERIDAIYSSPLERALETAQIINRHHKKEIIISDLVREKNYGAHEGMLDIKEVRRSSLPRHLYRPPGGETHEEVKQRASRFLDEILHRHRNGTVLVVSHGRLLKELMLHITGAPREQEDMFAHSNAGITMLDIEEDRSHRIHAVNYTGHLED